MPKVSVLMSVYNCEKTVRILPQWRSSIPRFVMEVLSNATEKYDRHEKMNIYCKVGVSEYWIVDWRKKSVEIYLFDFEEDGTGYPYLYKTVTAQNKEELQLVMFPNLKITFEELFDLGEY